MTKIFDCFTFLNEVELLELRLAELCDVVDYFVLVEANQTHSGNPKEFVFEAQQERYREYLVKIVYVQVTDMPIPTPDNYWVAENYQRNAIARGLAGLALAGDKILVSDVDEIPRTDAILANLDAKAWVLFRQHLYYYYVNCKARRDWGGTVMASYGTFSVPQDMRRFAKRHGTGIYPGGGWHYSYLTGDDPDRVLYKAQNIVDHFGYETQVGNRDDIQRKIWQLEDPYGRTVGYQKMGVVDISNNKPRMLDEWLEKYPQFFYRKSNEG